MKNHVQLIAYVDRLAAGGFRDLERLLSGRLAGLFGGAHLLPFFTPIDGADAGFDPSDHTTVDTRLGTWDDVKALGGTVELMADLIVNHASSSSPQFVDWSSRGAASAYAGMFLTYDRVFPEGATESELLAIYRPRPSLPFTLTTLASGEKRLLWTTFTPQQVDIDVQHPEAEGYLESIVRQFAAAGIRLVRLDAVGYAVKKAGSSCFMIPETFAFIAELSARAHRLGMEVLVEIHSHYLQQIAIAKQVDRVYDFALPPLVLHALYARDAAPLARWLAISPRNAVTVLDTHDGIGVVDVAADATGAPGLLGPAALHDLVEHIHGRSGGQSRQATGGAASNLDLYQVNCTFYDALGRNDDDYLIARALQFFAPGIPQVYYVGLLAGTNDMDLLARSNVGRDINRHYYTSAEIDAALASPVVQRQIALIRFRNTHPAFSGHVQIDSPADDRIDITWTAGQERAALSVDLTAGTAWITATNRTGSERFPVHAETGRAVTLPAAH